MLTSTYAGPTRFMADMRAALTELGVRPDRIHLEIFNGGESVDAGGRRRCDKDTASAAARPRNRPRWCRSRAAA